MADGRIAATRNLCGLGERMFEGHASNEQVAEIDGAPATLEEALAEAAKLLHKSHAPLIYGLSQSSTAGQRAAVRLADVLGATIDTTASTCHAPSIVALQAVGESTSTLGEVRHRSDLVVYWGSNPVESHPRHLERFVDAPGGFLDGGRSKRHLVVVDCQATETTALADETVLVTPGDDLELTWALRMLVQGKSLQSSGPIAGVPRQQIEQLARRMTEASYGALFFGLGVTHGETPHATVEGLLRLVTDLNAHTRFIARRMRIPGDVAGADCVLCWQTGFPFAVNLARGYPRYNPGEYTAGPLLERGEVDAAVLVGLDGVGKLSPAALERLAQIPTIVLARPGARSTRPAAVRITTGVYGIHYPGTAYRMDEVPIPLRSFLESAHPNDHDVLKRLTGAVDQRARGPSSPGRVADAIEFAAPSSSRVANPRSAS